MALRAKYQQLIDAATNSGVTNLQVREEGNVLYIDGNAPSEDVKKQIWDIFNKIDPDYRSGDLVLNLLVAGGGGTPATEEYEVVKGDSLSKIGQKYGVPWPEIYAANKDQIKDPNLIQPGWKLKIPKK
ncbi:LysM peptidoglycan-binding domain-containing protein [Chitinophagaceae bacterium LB-8]|jgi:nucleoid-associated protein YgaU|uniref:LysM peptidoglycan-binding domain-containing protein n=1 Tax=Paraflavisolibacter caeni TaxID=2982496 RepID=A0A9X2XRZ5_9BACT|nr:LysM peptidoglycan-binding domain-containing protein [Paraflavisolibacter caeni]MCU7547706.1 LysM peptidoglycan-binding domain-containing protein [Paraflavisolibacter caeni]